MGLPLLTALFGLGLATAVGGLVMRVVDVPDWAPPVAAMVGIGVGIDYSLLIVTRFRSGLAQGQDPRRATLSAVDHRRPRRHHRRAHGGRVPAGHPADATAVDDRVRLLGHPCRAHRHGRVGHPAARDAGLRGSQHRALARAVRQPRGPCLRRVALVPVEPVRPAPASARRCRQHRAPAGAGVAVPRHPVRVPGREQRPAELHHPPGVRPARRRLRSRLLRAAAAHRAGADRSGAADRRGLAGSPAEPGRRRGRGRAGGRQPVR